MTNSLSEHLTPDALRRLASEQSFERGVAYAEKDRVFSVDWKERNVATGIVLGTLPYQVELRGGEEGLEHACSCPHGQQGVFCKHLVALALKASAVVGRGEGQGASTKRTMRKRGGSSEGPFETREALRQWLGKHGLEAVGRFAASVLERRLDPHKDRALIQALHRHRLFDVASEEGIRLAAYGITHVPGRERILEVAWRYLDEERVQVEEARTSLGTRLSPPQDSSRHPLHASLLALRRSFPAHVPPRPDGAFDPERLKFVPALPGFTWRDERRCESKLGWGFLTPEVKLRLSAEGADVDCNCGESRCHHALFTVDQALLWLQLPAKAEYQSWLDEMLRPAWERSLRELERVLTDATSAKTTQVTWRVSVGPFYVEVAPYVHRLGKRGYSSGSRVSISVLLSAHRHALTDQDLRIAALHSERTSRSERALLLELVGHPRLFLETAPDRPVRAERAWVGLVAQERGGTVVLSLGVDGTPLPPELLKRLSNGGHEESQFLWDEGSRRLTVLEIAKETQAMMGVLQAYGNEFPPESHGALLEKLSLASNRVPVTMPRSVMGEAVMPLSTPVVRLELQPGGRVRVELRTRTLPESMAFLPGVGPKDVHVRRGAQALHAVRDFAAEERSATRVAEALSLADPVDVATEPFIFELGDAQSALEVLARCREMQPPPEIEWRGDPLRLLGSASAPSLRVVLEKRRDWFGALGGLSVAGERVELAVLLDAARRKQRFVQAGPGSYVEIEEKLRAQLERLSDHTYRSAHGVEIGPSAVEAITGLENSGVEVQADEVWQSLAQRIFAAGALNPRTPSTLKADLRDYQREGFRWLARLAAWGAGGVLADDMGLGKTVQALALLLDRARLGPSLVVAPTSVGFNWVDEAKRFAPSLRMLTYADVADRGAALERLGPKDVLVLSYGLLTRDIERLQAVKFGTIVFDEAQALKNGNTQRTRAARLLQGDFKFALSGTPLENHLGELWSIFRIVFPGLLGSWEAFRTRFANPIEKNIDPTAAPALARLLQPFLLRRTKMQVEQELPERTDIRVPVVLSPEEWELYEDARLAAISDLETPRAKLKEQERRIEVLAALTRLRLLASHPRLYDAASTVRSAKLERFLELVEELIQGGHRALVFSQFTSHLALIREVLDERKIRYEYLDGQTPRKERARCVQTFQEGDAPLFLISLKAGGFGLNLTEADYVIHLDPWWNPAVEDQASDRAHRIGQKRPVTVYRLVTRGTIEEQILALHEDKRALVAGVLEGKEQAARLSTQELLGLLTASAPLSDIEAPATRH